MEVTDAALTRLTRCPICSGSRFDPFRRLGSWSLDRCRRCRFVFLNPQPTPEHLAELYNSPAYFAERVDETPSTEKARTRAASLVPVIQNLERILGRKGRLLEIGCGYGFLLGAAQSAGWDVRGLELSSHASAFARDTFNVDIQNAGADSLDRQDMGTFDVVVMLSVIEHLPQPLPVLQQVRAALADKGLLWAVVPNVASFDRCWHGERWSGWDLPYHLWHFSPATMKSFLRGAGFQCINVEPTFFNPVTHLKVAWKLRDWRVDCRPWKVPGMTAPRPSPPVAPAVHSNGGRNSALRRLVKALRAERDMNVWAFK